MGIAFWIRRFVLIFCLVFAVLACVHLLRGHELLFTLKESLLWGIITANIFVASRIYDSRRGRLCALCNDTPPV